MSSPVARTPRSSHRRARPTGRCWWRASLGQGGGAVGDLRRGLPGPALADPFGTGRDGRRPALRLAGPGHLRRARRRPRRRPARRGDGVPPRRWSCCRAGRVSSSPTGTPPPSARRCATSSPNRAWRVDGARSGRLAPAFGWPAVARQYAALADDLFADGPNLNQGAEPTLSLISTFQHGRRLVGMAP